jgi:hypothetical protein
MCPSFRPSLPPSLSSFLYAIPLCSPSFPPSLPPSFSGQSTLGFVYEDSEGGKYSLCLYPNGDNLSREGQLGVFVKVRKRGGGKEGGVGSREGENTPCASILTVIISHGKANKECS